MLDRSCHDLARHHTVGHDAGRLPQRPPGHARDAAAHDAAARAAAARRADDLPEGHRPGAACCSTPRRAAPASRFDAGSDLGARAGRLGVPAGGGQRDVGAHLVVLLRAAGHHGQLADDASGRAPGRPAGVPVVPAVAPPGVGHERRRHPVNYDAGTVEVADTTHGAAARRRPRGLPWVNGPHDVITDQFGNPSAGRVGFSRDSRGYLASRLAADGVRRARGRRRSSR